MCVQAKPHRPRFLPLLNEKLSIPEGGAPAAIASHQPAFGVFRPPPTVAATPGALRREVSTTLRGRAPRPSRCRAASASWRQAPPRASSADPSRTDDVARRVRRAARLGPVCEGDRALTRLAHL